ncbi:MAG: hypothetical protein R3343_00740 [Nitriliruptorales bacterium]|nr:hypothetical protein [Nitriliruptorales bacterium]
MDDPSIDEPELDDLDDDLVEPDDGEFDDEGDFDEDPETFVDDDIDDDGDSEEDDGYAAADDAPALDAAVLLGDLDEELDIAEEGEDGLQEGEFVCTSCFMAKRESALADATKMLCRDCA